MPASSPCETARTHFRNNSPKNGRDDQMIKLYLGNSKLSGHALGNSNNCETDGLLVGWLVGWLVG